MGKTYRGWKRDKASKLARRRRQSDRLDGFEDTFGGGRWYGKGVKQWRNMDDRGCREES